MGRFLRIEPGAYFLGALCLYLLPLRWVTGAFIAATVHEAGHLLALKLTGVPVYSVTLGSMGAKIEMGAPEPGQEILCALAGPAGSFLMLLLCNVFPEATLCGLVQGVFNLLPVYPMDGGRALRCLVGEKKSCWIENMVSLLLLISGVYAGIVLNMGLWTCFPGIILAGKRRNRKFPCNETKKAVQ